MSKAEIMEIIDKLPEDCTIEDVQYSLYVHSKIDKGLKDIKEGNVITHDEVKERMDKWFENNR